MSDSLEDIFINNTINQHYLSQIEQRLNSSNKNAQPKNQEIFLFSIDEINALGYHATSSSKKIVNSLMEQDLFSIRTKKNERLNLENLMSPLEGDFANSVQAFLRDDIICNGSENEKIENLKKILSLKMMSTFRNPYYIESTLRTINFGTNFILESEKHLIALVNIYKKQNNIKRLSQKFNVSEDKYISWINTLIALLLNSEKKNSLVEGMIDQIFLADELIHFITLYTYDDDVVFLPEAGMYQITDIHKINYFINLSSKAFLVISSYALTNLGEMRISPELLQFIMNKCGNEIHFDDFIKKIKRNKTYTTTKNNYEILKVFNSQCALYGKRHILFSQPKINDTIFEHVQQIKQ